jgi:hypothetical protein
MPPFHQEPREQFLPIHHFRSTYLRFPLCLRDLRLDKAASFGEVGQRASRKRASQTVPFSQVELAEPGSHRSDLTSPACADRYPISAFVTQTIENAAQVDRHFERSLMAAGVAPGIDGVAGPAAPANPAPPTC